MRLKKTVGSLTVGKPGEVALARQPAVPLRVQHGPDVKPLLLPELELGMAPEEVMVAGPPVGPHLFRRQGVLHEEGELSLLCRRVPANPVHPRTGHYEQFKFSDSGPESRIWSAELDWS